MPKYVFSQGKVTVEAGVYLPLIKRDRRASRAAMVALIACLPRDEEPEAISQDKENLPYVHAG
jgi:hypothetical protein